MKLCWIVVLVGISIILVFLYSLVAMPILHRYAGYLTRIFTDSVFIQSFYTRCFQKDMAERR